MNTKKKKTTERAAKVLLPARVGKVTRRQAVKAVKAALKEEAAAKKKAVKKKAAKTKAARANRTVLVRDKTGVPIAVKTVSNVSKFTMRLPNALKKRLKRLSKKTNVPMAHYVQESIEHGLLKYEKKGQ